MTELDIEVYLIEEIQNVKCKARIIPMQINENHIDLGILINSFIN